MNIYSFRRNSFAAGMAAYACLVPLTHSQAQVAVREPLPVIVDRSIPTFAFQCNIREVRPGHPEDGCWEFAVADSHIRTDVGSTGCSHLCRAARGCGTLPSGSSVICWPPQPDPDNSGTEIWSGFVTFVDKLQCEAPSNAGPCSDVDRVQDIKFYRRVDSSKPGYSFDLYHLPDLGAVVPVAIYIKPGVPFILYDNGPNLDVMALGSGDANFVAEHYRRYNNFGQCQPSLVQDGTHYVDDNTNLIRSVAISGGLQPSNWK